ncbi:MAG: FKBP-type peptidyl-prolyl cis-trans isomerase [Bacteroidales bacterium]|jgi:FKBP-type peptidyl-prolyl cis-trans isomerase FklB|nr:FKBP-type peptidyl-prolyl cis-trans isomerase [Bacteroidales bacterium]
MKYNSFFPILILFLLGSIDARGQQPMSNADSVSFFLGYMYGKQISTSNIEGFNVDAFSGGLKNAVNQISVGMNDQEINAFLQKYFTNLQRKANDALLKQGREFLEENSKREGITTLPSGLQYRIIRQGTGAKPKAVDDVEVIYHGTLIDGTVFDSAKERGTPLKLSVSGVIRGFSEALQLMPEGSIWEIFIPAELGYGENVNPQGKIRPNSVLIFEIDLLKVVKKETIIPKTEPNYFQ